MNTAISDIQAERHRQIHMEGWSSDHDDAHQNGELLQAAMSYFYHAMGRATYRPNGTPADWPWESTWWKPKSKRHDLVRAGALASAEKERIQRLDGDHIAINAVEHLINLIAFEITDLDQAAA